jgi:hypothetical protein
MPWGRKAEGIKPGHGATKGLITSPGPPPLMTLPTRACIETMKALASFFGRARLLPPIIEATAAHIVVLEFVRISFPGTATTTAERTPVIVRP